MKATRDGFGEQLVTSGKKQPQYNRVKCRFR